MCGSGSAPKPLELKLQEYKLCMLPLRVLVSASLCDYTPGLEDLVSEVQTLTLAPDHLSQDGQSRTIRQFQFTDWPEQGVPKTGEGFIDFIGQVHKTKEQFGQDGPITVHCRWGGAVPT